MKVICDFCGSSYDTDNNSTCPSCGGTHADNIMVKNERQKQGILTNYEKIRLEEQARKQKLENDKREQAVELEKQTTQVQKILKIGCLIPFVLFVIGIVIVIIMAFWSSIKENFIDNKNDKNSDIMTDTEVVAIVETPVTVGFNETAATSKYSIICDKYEVVDSYPFSANNGYQYVKFHFVFENLTNDYINFSKIKMNCLSDGLACESRWKTGVKGIPGSVDRGLKADGNEVFEVPIDTKEFDIKYGDYITIHFENELNKQ